MQPPCRKQIKKSPAGSQAWPPGLDPLEEVSPVVEEAVLALEDETSGKIAAAMVAAAAVATITHVGPFSLRRFLR